MCVLDALKVPLRGLRGKPLASPEESPLGFPLHGSVAKPTDPACMFDPPTFGSPNPADLVNWDVISLQSAHNSLMHGRFAGLSGGISLMYGRHLR